MLPANDVASVLIARNGPWVDAMRLQKLLYYVQAWHLAITDEPLFPEPIKAWRDGPVIPQVRIARSDQGTRRAAAQKIDDIELDDLTSDLIDLVSAAYGSMSGDELSALTHVEEPWKSARGNLPDDAPCQKRIDPALMAKFYRTHRLLGGRTAADLAAGGLHLRNLQASGPVDIDRIFDSLGDEFDDPGDDPWGGANLDLGERYDDNGIETSQRRSYAGA